ncbi:MAG: argininosuccinate synthase, partial [Fusobacterium sp.]
MSIDFEKGVPVKLNGEKLEGVELINKLNEIGAKHGVGVID